MLQEETKIITLESIDEENSSALPYNLLLADKVDIENSDVQSPIVSKFYIDQVIGVPVKVDRFRKSIVRIKG